MELCVKAKGTGAKRCVRLLLNNLGLSWQDTATLTPLFWGAFVFMGEP